MFCLTGCDTESLQELELDVQEQNLKDLARIDQRNLVYEEIRILEDVIYNAVSTEYSLGKGYLQGEELYFDEIQGDTELYTVLSEILEDKKEAIDSGFNFNSETCLSSDIYWDLNENTYLLFYEIVLSGGAGTTTLQIEWNSNGITRLEVGQI